MCVVIADDSPSDGSTSACVRCKGLKVRVNIGLWKSAMSYWRLSPVVQVKFITDLDTCKHCLNGGHECVIPECKRRSSFPYVPSHYAPHLSAIYITDRPNYRVRAPALADPSAGGRDPQLEEANRHAEAHTPGDASSPSPSHSGTTKSFSLMSRLMSPEVEATGEVVVAVVGLQQLNDRLGLDEDVV